MNDASNPWQAVVFDMDGVLMDTVGFWVEAERQVFGSLGVQVTAALAAQTSSMTTAEVTDFWYARQPWLAPEKSAVEASVIEYVKAKIESDGCEIEGVRRFIDQCQSKGLLLGLATNSPRVLMDTVLRKMGYVDVFRVKLCADDVTKAKPDPEIYRSCVAQLSVNANRVLVVEDSLSGADAAKRAGCHVALLGAVDSPDADWVQTVTSFDAICI